MTTALTLCGSLRAGAHNEKLRQIMSAKLRDHGVEVEDLDLSHYALPIFNEDLEAEGIPEAAILLGEKLARHDAVFIASPEYNSGVAPLIVNTVAWLSRLRPNPFRHAVFGLGAVSSGKYGGIAGIYHLRDMLMKLDALVAPTLLGIGPASTAFTPEGELAEDGIKRKVEAMARQLVQFSRGA
jgi:chromate reductase, NAD(P)H dehydrogenase (quinone)